MNLTPAQSLIATDTHRFRVAVCGRRFGKSTLAAWEMYAKAVSTDDGRVTYIAPTFAQARDIVWMELKKICDQLQTNINESRLEIAVKNIKGNTSLITLHGWESVETMRGQKYDMLVLDEIANMKNFNLLWQEVLRPALTDRKGHGLFIGTPRGFDHLYDLYNMENDQIKGQDYKSFHFTTYDNPYIDPEEIEKAKQELTEDRFSQEYMADFRKMEGLVYKEFDRKIHVVDTIPELIVETLGAVDFGYRNPTAVLTGKKDYDGRYYISEEFYKTEQTEDQVVDMIVTKKFNKVYPDPENASAIASLEKRGVNIRPVAKGKGSIVSGIKKVREMFKQNKLFIHKSCIHTIQELESYAYPDWSPEKNADELPIGKDNHAMDALRYLIMSDAVDNSSTVPKVHYGTQRRPSAGRVNFNKMI
jgi:PBSX family phage terminase large subunit